MICNDMPTSLRVFLTLLDVKEFLFIKEKKSVIIQFSSLLQSYRPFSGFGSDSKRKKGLRGIC